MRGKGEEDVLRIHFMSEDFGKITLVPHADALWEVLSSLHLLQEHEKTLVFGEWRNRVRRVRPRGLELLLELAPPRGYSLDFLTPSRGEREIEALADKVLSTPRKHLREDLNCLAVERPVTSWMSRLAIGDIEALHRLGGALTEYYRIALAPYMHRIDAQIQIDCYRRAHDLLAGGVDRLLSGLHPKVSWESPVLMIDDYVDGDMYLDGRGLVLLPSIFCRRRPFTLKDRSRPPVLVYPVSASLDWLYPAKSSERALNALLGRTRVAALQACVSACTTTDLSRRLGLSVSGASRQAGVLREAGLITTVRDGTTVRHEITGIGKALLNGKLPQPYEAGGRTPARS